MRPTLWELDSQTEKGGNLFISVLVHEKEVKKVHTDVETEIVWIKIP